MGHWRKLTSRRAPGFARPLWGSSTFVGRPRGTISRAQGGCTLAFPFLSLGGLDQDWWEHFWWPFMTKFHMFKKISWKNLQKLFHFESIRKYEPKITKFGGCCPMLSHHQDDSPRFASCSTATLWIAALGGRRPALRWKKVAISVFFQWNDHKIQQNITKYHKIVRQTCCGWPLFEVLLLLYALKIKYPSAAPWYGNGKVLWRCGQKYWNGQLIQMLPFLILDLTSICKKGWNWGCHGMIQRIFFVFLGVTVPRCFWTVGIMKTNRKISCHLAKKWKSLCTPKPELPLQRLLSLTYFAFPLQKHVSKLRTCNMFQSLDYQT